MKSLITIAALSSLAAAQSQIQLVLPETPAGVGTFPTPAYASIQGSNKGTTTYVFTCSGAPKLCTNYDPNGWTVTVNPTSAHWALVYPNGPATTTIDYAFARPSGSSLYAGSITYAGAEYATTTTSCAPMTLTVNVDSKPQTPPPVMTVSEGGSAVATMTGGKPTTYASITSGQTAGTGLPGQKGVSQFEGAAAGMKVSIMGAAAGVAVGVLAML